MFTAKDYHIISQIVFDTEIPYPGYRPNVVESPNGDGYWDGEKRYAHIALKYLQSYKELNKQITDPVLQEKAFTSLYALTEYLKLANDRAVAVAIELGVPKLFWPDIRYGAIRILEYPPGAVTHPHKDFNLFTLMCYRNVESNFKYINVKPPKYNLKEDTELKVSNELLVEANTLNHQIHFGEILELVLSCYKATPHEVVADESGRTQYSIGYFTIPNHEVKLPDDQTVGQWLDVRLTRSRKEVEVK